MPLSLGSARGNDIIHLSEPDNPFVDGNGRIPRVAPATHFG